MEEIGLYKKIVMLLIWLLEEKCEKMWFGYEFYKEMWKDVSLWWPDRS
jgi:hypothetical protein